MQRSKEEKREWGDTVTDKATNNKGLEYCNREIASYTIQTKDQYRQYANFAEKDPSFDFQLCYVKFRTKPHPVTAYHKHRDSSEIKYILHGNQSFQIDEIEYRLSGGDILLSPPRLWHGGQNTHEEKGDFYYLNINPDKLDEILPHTRNDEMQVLNRMLISSPVQIRCSHSENLRDLLDKLLQLHNMSCSFWRLRVQNILCELLLSTADAIYEEHLDEPSSPFMKNVYSYIEEHLTENLTVDALASKFGYSKTTFQNIFKSNAYRTVHEYILYRKIEIAKMMLADEATEALEIWELLSFSSADYFQKVFKRYTGKTVLQYKESLAKI